MSCHFTLNIIVEVAIETGGYRIRVSKVANIAYVVCIQQYQMAVSSPAWVSPIPHWHALDLSATMLLLFSLLLMLELR